jgi:hypothetical protein
LFKDKTWCYSLLQTISVKLDVCCIFFFYSDILTCTGNNIQYGVTSGLIYSTNQSAMSLLNLMISKPSTHQELISDWSIYLTVLHMIGLSKMSERLHDMTSISVLFCPRTNWKKIQQTSNLNEFVLQTNYLLQPLLTK